VYTTVPAILSLLSGDEEELSVLKGIERTSGSVPLVHVEDVCRAEIFAAETAADGRYIVNGLDTTIADMARFLADKYPQYNVDTNNLSGDVLEKPIALLACCRPRSWRRKGLSSSTRRWRSCTRTWSSTARSWESLPTDRSPCVRARARARFLDRPIKYPRNQLPLPRQKAKKN